MLGYAVQVAVEVDLVGVEVDAGKVGGVMAQTAELLNTVIAAHIPADMVGVSHHNLGNRRSPATAADNRYLTTVEHVSIDN